MKALITGGAGFIGSHTVETFLSNGWEVVVVDSLITGNKENLPTDVRVIEMDIADHTVIDMIEFEKPNVVIHLAAQADVQHSILAPDHDTISNVLGTVHVLEGCRKTKAKIVFSSTAGVYGDSDVIPLSENSPLDPLSFYALSKKAAEEYIRLYSNLFGIPYTILRYSNVYGPRQKAKGEGGVVAIFLERLKKKIPLTVFGDGNQTRDFIYVKDVANANFQAATNATNSTLHVSTRVSTSVNQIISYLKELHPEHFYVEYVDMRKGEIIDSCLDNTKALENLSWKPQFDLQVGLRHTYDYFFRH